MVGMPALRIVAVFDIYIWKISLLSEDTGPKSCLLNYTGHISPVNCILLSVYRSHWWLLRWPLFLRPPPESSERHGNTPICFLGLETILQGPDPEQNAPISSWESLSYLMSSLFSGKLSQLTASVSPIHLHPFNNLRLIPLLWKSLSELIQMVKHTENKDETVRCHSDNEMTVAV